MEDRYGGDDYSLGGGWGDNCHGEGEYGQNSIGSDGNGGGGEVDCHNDYS